MNRWLAIAAAVLSLLTLGCPAGPPSTLNRPLNFPSRTTSGHSRAAGAGATFPEALYQRWIEDYKETHAGVGPEYKAIGSLAGLTRLYNYKVDFAATDWPQEVDRPSTLQFPTVAGAVVIIYNVEGFDAPLNLTPELLGNIFSGSVTTWNLVRPDLKPDKITIVHRSEASGTTRVLSQFLTLRSKETWNKGADWVVRWPSNSIPATGSDEVAKAVLATPNSIGYVEYTYAQSNGLKQAFIQNNANQFVQANPNSIEAAISGPPETGDAQEVALAILRDPRKQHDAYPITALTWIVMPVISRVAEASLGPRGFFQWTLSQRAQTSVESLGYVELSPQLLAWEEREINRPPSDPKRPAGTPGIK